MARRRRGSFIDSAAPVSAAAVYLSVLLSMARSSSVMSPSPSLNPYGDALKSSSSAEAEAEEISEDTARIREDEDNDDERKDDDDDDP